MLKRKLITIAIITLGLGITSAFGQAADWEIRAAVKNPKTSVKKSNSVKVRKPQQVQPGNSGGTISNQRTARNSQNKLGNFEIQVKKNSRDVATGQSSGKRQHSPIKRKNLGDTGTHEVGHKQGKRRN